MGSAAEAASRDYAHWAGEVRRLTEEIARTVCPHESPSELETHAPPTPSCFRAASEQPDRQGRRTLDQIAGEVADCRACSDLVLLIRARRQARQRFGVAKRAVRSVGKKLLTLTTSDR